MAIGAHRDFRISGREPLPVHARLVLAELVRPQARIVLPYVFRIGVAATAKFRNLLAIDLSFPSGLLAHGDFRIVAGRITAMAARARQAFLRVNILTKSVHGHTEGSGQIGMAIEAGVL